MVGTICAWVTRWRSISSERARGSKRSITTVVPPSRCTAMLKRSGAEW